MKGKTTGPSSEPSVMLASMQAVTGDEQARAWAPFIEGWKQRAARARAESERRLEQARADARRLAGVLAREYGVSKVYLFGSLVTGQMHSRSDIDLAVEGLPPALYYQAWARLERETDLPVDLVDLSRAGPSLVERVAREGVLLYERHG